MIGLLYNETSTVNDFERLCPEAWRGQISVSLNQGVYRIRCDPDQLVEISQWLLADVGCVFATLVAEKAAARAPTLSYIFIDPNNKRWISIDLVLEAGRVSSLVGFIRGPSFDWHERETSDLFGIQFEGHPRLGGFVLHEDWPGASSPMLKDVDAYAGRESRGVDSRWNLQTIVAAPGSFAMPIGPVFSDFAESAQFLLETVGEDVIRTIPRFFYKYRGVEKRAENQLPDYVLLLAERFSGTSAFANGMGFCQAVEKICSIEVPARASVLRTIFAELERLRYHVSVISNICNSTALVVAASQLAIIEEELLRLCCCVTQHRYLFGSLALGGLARDTPIEMCTHLQETISEAGDRLGQLETMLRFSSSFLDRLEEVGRVSHEQALDYGLLGPVGRASGLVFDVRKLFPYAAYDKVDFGVPVEQEGDGYARLRLFFREANHSVAIIQRLTAILPEGPIRANRVELRDGAALAAIEAPAGAAFHWVRLKPDGTVDRYRVTPPSFANWHGFHLAAENFAFQDFPIILATFGLWNAECDR